ncbi:MAG: phage tail terminator-like protein [Devosia sp.]|nr:phage tail terminator-like protein [Devosia sp.]
MSTDAVYSAVQAFLTDNWTATPLVFENGSGEPPIAPDGSLIPWVEVEVAGNAYSQISIGAGSPADNRWREEGQVWFHVFVKTGAGSLLARQLATALTGLFRGAQLDPDIEFGDMSVGLGEPGDDDGNYWRLSVSIDWFRGA